MPPFQLHINLVWSVNTSIELVSIDSLVLQGEISNLGVKYMVKRENWSDLTNWDTLSLDSVNPPQQKATNAHFSLVRAHQYNLSAVSTIDVRGRRVTNARWTTWSNRIWILWKHKYCELLSSDRIRIIEVSLLWAWSLKVFSFFCRLPNDSISYSRALSRDFSWDLGLWAYHSITQISSYNNQCLSGCEGIFLMPLRYWSSWQVMKSSKFKLSNANIYL